jgi:hypothetical protein
MCDPAESYACLNFSDDGITGTKAYALITGYLEQNAMLAKLN